MTENENLVPEWMKKKQQEIEAVDAKRELEAQRALTAQLLIEKNGPTFWKSLKEKLNITVNALSTIGLSGSFTSPFESNHIHIEVMRPGNFPDLTNIDMHFDGKQIHCAGLIGAFNLRLVVKFNNEVGSQPEDRPTACLDADQTSEFIMRRMTDRVLR